MISEREITTRKVTNPTIFLNPERKSPLAEDFAKRLQARIVGQERAVRQVSNLYQTFMAGRDEPATPSYRNDFVSWANRLW